MQDVDLGRQATADSLGTTAATFVTAESVLTPLAETPEARGDVASTADSGAAAKGQRRKLAPPLGRARAATHAQHIAELKSYFDEVWWTLVVLTSNPAWLFTLLRAELWVATGGCVSAGCGDANPQENPACRAS